MAQNRRAADTRSGATANLPANIGTGANHGAPRSAGPVSRKKVSKMKKRHHIDK